MSRHTSAIQAIGFPAPVDVSGLQSVAHLFGGSKRRCGIYLLVMPDDRYYVGRSTNVVRRFVQQLRDRGPIAGFAFIPAPRRELKAREKELVRLGEMQGLTLLNVSLVSDVVAASVLEELLPASVIERWLTCPIAENRSDLNATPFSFPMAKGLGASGT